MQKHTANASSYLPLAINQRGVSGIKNAPMRITPEKEHCSHRGIYTNPVNFSHIPGEKKQATLTLQALLSVKFLFVPYETHEAGIAYQQCLRQLQLVQLQGGAQALTPDKPEAVVDPRHYTSICWVRHLRHITWTSSYTTAPPVSPFTPTAGDATCEGMYLLTGRRRHQG